MSISVCADMTAVRDRSAQIAYNALREAENMLREVLARGPSLQPVVRLSHLDCEHPRWANHSGVASCLLCGVLETQISDGAELANRLAWEHRAAQERGVAGPVSGNITDDRLDYLETLGALDDGQEENQSAEGWR